MCMRGVYICIDMYLYDATPHIVAYMRDASYDRQVYINMYERRAHMHRYVYAYDAIPHVVACIYDPSNGKRVRMHRYT